VVGATRALLGPSLARAHGVSTPTRNADPIVEALLDREPRVMGRLTPPPARYCRVKVGFGRADADARQVPEDRRIVGRTLRLEGATLDDGAPIALESELAFDAELSLATAIEVSDGRTFTVHVRKAIDGWLDGVDVTGDPAAAARRMAENVRGSLRVEID